MSSAVRSVSNCISVRVSTVPGGRATGSNCGRPVYGSVPKRPAPWRTHIQCPAPFSGGGRGAGGLDREDEAIGVSFVLPETGEGEDGAPGNDDEDEHAPEETARAARARGAAGGTAR